MDLVAQNIFHFIREQILLHGSAPTQRTIMQALKIKSKSYLGEVINTLVDNELLERAPGKARALFLTEKSMPDHRVMGKIAAGKPVESIPDEQRYNLYSVLFPPGTFSLVIAGDSMIDEGLFDGDVVIMKPAQTAKNGQIVYAQVDGSEVTLKRMYVKPDRIILKACNPSYPPMEYDPERIEIRGIFHKGIAMNR